MSAEISGTPGPLGPLSASLTRFAPAPTGWLHLGHVLNALYVWNTARAAGDMPYGSLLVGPTGVDAVPGAVIAAAAAWLVIAALERRSKAQDAAVGEPVHATAG